MVKNRHIVRVGAREMSLYNTMRLAERFAGVPSDFESRSRFIRSWVSGKESDPVVQNFLMNGLRLKTKRFGTELKQMEARLYRLSRYARHTTHWTDEQRLDGALQDLEKSGYLIKRISGSELAIDVSPGDAKKLTTYGLIGLNTDELKQLKEGWLDERDLVVNFMSYFPAPFIAAVDALEIAGFVVEAPPSFKKGELLELRLRSSKKSEFRKLLEKLPIPSEFEEGKL